MWLELIARWWLVFFYLWLERKREHGAKWQISLKKVRKNPLIFCMLIRVPLFANSNSWGTNLGSETSYQTVDRLQTFIQISRRHFVKNQVTCLRYFGHMIKVSSSFQVCSTIWRSEVFSVHVCKYWSLFVLTLGFLRCNILLESYVNAWCLCILRTIACWWNGNGIGLHVEIVDSR